MNARREIGFHDHMALRWEELHRSRVFRHRTEAMFGLLDAFPSPGPNWLDAGCGTGTLSRLLVERGLYVRGIDASTSMIEAARALAKKLPSSDMLSFEHIDTIERLPFPPKTFDGILCASVIEYLETPARCLAEFNRVLRDDGLLLISLANRASLVRQSYKIARQLASVAGIPVFNYLEFSRFDINAETAVRLLERHGFAVLDLNFTGTPLPHFLNARKRFGSLINIVARRRASSTSI